MTVGATLVASLVAVLDRPSTWPLALASFLIRGGWLVILVPIVVLPTVGGLANLFAPFLEDVAFGRRTSEVVGSLSVVAALVALWLVGGGLVAAVAEAEAIRRIAVDASSTSDEGATRVLAERRRGGAWRIVVVRLVAYLPLLLALTWAGWRVVTVGYRELTIPSDVAMPLAWRVALGAPDAIALVGAAWLLGETVGGVAARRIVLAGRGSRVALREAIDRVRRAPRRTTGLALVTALGVVGMLGIAALAVGTAWEAVRAAFARGDTAPLTIVLVVVFVGLFAGGLVLVALTVAWRSAVWTVEMGTPANGTFGGGDRSRSGDWNGAERSGTVGHRIGPRGGPGESEVMDDGAVDRVRHMHSRGPLRTAVVPVMRRAPRLSLPAPPPRIPDRA